MEFGLFQRELERELPEQIIETLIFQATVKTLLQFFYRYNFFAQFRRSLFCIYVISMYIFTNVTLLPVRGFSSP